MEEKKVCTFKPDISKSRKARSQSSRLTNNETQSESGIYQRTKYWLEQK